MSSSAKSIEQLEQLYKFSEVINRSSALDDVYEQALVAIKKLLKVDKAAILLFDSDGVMRFKDYLGLSKKYRKAVEGHSPWKKDTKNPAPVLVSDIKREPTLTHLKKTILSEGIQSLAFFPLLAKDSLIGKFMIYYNVPHNFTPEEIELATIMGRHISFVINKRKVSEEFLNSINDGITIQDISGGLVFVNNTAAITSGYKSAEEMLKNPKKWVNRFELKDEQGNPFELDDLPGRKALRGISSQALIQYKDLKLGISRWVVIKANPAFDEEGKVKMSINIIHDVTEIMELEKRKDEFISTASHELKTPIATLKGFAQILEMQVKDQNSKYYLSKINGQIDRLSMLVNDLLDVSRIQSGKLRLKKEKFNIVQLVEEVASDFHLVKNSHKIVVKNGIPKKYIYGDKFRIDEVLKNLLSNAIKFSPRSDKIIITLKSNPKDLVIAVRDFGIGITKRNIERVFEPFFQPSNRIRQSFSGLGLGLYISSQIVEQHRGKIWVDSKKGKGTTFYFSLPVN